MNGKIYYMKQYSILSLFLVLLFTACKKEETAFDQSPDERLNEALNKYQSILASSPTGWNATMLAGNGVTYNFHFRFNNANRVFMYADINSEAAATANESSYRLKAMQTPSLIFDTYSYIHVLSDPDASKNGGAYGQGLATDFEFSLDSQVADTVMLTGRKNGTKIKLVRSTPQEFDAWQNGGWAKSMSFENINKIQNYFKRVSIGGVNYEVRVNVGSRTITFIWVDGSGNVQQFTTKYNYSATGVVLVTPLATGTETISQIEIVGWDNATSTINVKVNGNASTIAGNARPLAVDLNAPRRWFQQAVNDGEYWFSQNGFHVNGVDDAFNIKSLDKYYYLIYWPSYAPGSNDLFAPVFINAAGTSLELLYGAAPRVAQFTTDGRAIFSLLGNYGSYPTTGPAAQSRAQLLSPQGYYFIQTGQNSYDMVSATDAKAWVSWIR